ncbi:MAG: helix-turn-helix transcriptional regulator [Thermodesulfobacteriota bacterium]
MTEKKKIRLQRLYNLAQMIEQGDNASPKNLIKTLKVSKSQLHRDLKELKLLGFETVFERDQNKYVLVNHPRDIGRTLTASEQIALVLCLVQLGEIKDSYILRQSRAAAMKILNNSNGEPPHFLRNSLRLPKIVDGYGCQANILKSVCRALQEKKRIIITYAKPGMDPDDYEINPYQIYMYCGSPYLDAYAWDRQDIRCFKLCRIKAVKPTGLSFSSYRDYDFDVHHRYSFGIYAGQQPEDVLLWFSSRAAPYICEEYRHPTQKIEHNQDGSIHYSVTVPEPREVMWWSFQWAEDSAVLKPQWLRDMACEKIIMMSENYPD